MEIGQVAFLAKKITEIAVIDQKQKIRSSFHPYIQPGGPDELNCVVYNLQKRLSAGNVCSHLLPNKNEHICLLICKPVFIVKYIFITSKQYQQAHSATSKQLKNSPTFSLSSESIWAVTVLDKAGKVTIRSAS